MEGIFAGFREEFGAHHGAKAPELHFKEFPNTLQACSEMLRGETGRAATRSGASPEKRLGGGPLFEAGWGKGRMKRRFKSRREAAPPRFAIMAERGKDGCSTEPVTAQERGRACLPAGKRLVSVAPPVWAALPRTPWHTASLFAAGADVESAGGVNRQRRYAGTGAVQREIVFAPPHRVRKLFFGYDGLSRLPRTYRRLFIAGTDGGESAGR